MTITDTIELLCMPYLPFRFYNRPGARFDFWTLGKHVLKAHNRSKTWRPQVWMAANCNVPYAHIISKYVYCELEENNIAEVPAY